MPKKVAIVEDEAELAALIEYNLGRHGYEAQILGGTKGTLRSLEQAKPDLILLDVMLPDVDGFELCRQIRQSAVLARTPVLFLTARDHVDDRVKGLELGADDYLVKPFAFSELLARVRTLLRRGSKTTAAEFLHAADLELDLMRRRVTRAGRRIDLTAKEFALLELLLRRQGEVLPRSLIASQVWDMNFDSDTNVIEVAMRRLRVKLDDNFEPKLIRTVRGMGYVLENPDCA